MWRRVDLRPVARPWTSRLRFTPPTSVPAANCHRMELTWLRTPPTMVRVMVCGPAQDFELERNGCERTDFGPNPKHDENDNDNENATENENDHDHDNCNNNVITITMS